MILDLFLGGVETVSNTLTWGIVFMIRNPDVQAKVQKEIDDVTALERRPQMSDKARMPFTTATLLEIQRCANISAVGVPHIATEDITIAGYEIPKGTRVLYHIHYMLIDPRYWKEPTKFDPSNFLDDDGHVLKRDAMMPFGIGNTHSGLYYIMSSASAN